MATINPYLSFSGNTREAMSFYQSCLGGQLQFMPFAETPMAGDVPEEMQQNIVHSCLMSGSIVLMASDMAGPEGIQTGNNISITLQCDSEEEINDLYAKLAEGGTATHTPQPAFWGGHFGHLVDKFGVTWLLNYTPVACMTA